VPPELTRAQARLDLAVTRGLLLDLLATGDRPGADDAIEQYMALFEAWGAQRPAASTTSARAGRVTPVVAREVRVLLVPGSLRRASTNTAVLRTAQALAPVLVTTVLYDGLGSLPSFNPDDDVVPLPPTVAELRTQVREADALLFSVPEYAGGLPGSFKNLLDWTIGDDHPGSIYEKPVAWINASVRTASDAHESLRKVLGYAKASIVEAACVHVPVAPALVDDDGRISDRGTRAAVAGSLVQLAAVAGAPAEDR
jgi:NAD(P)H-dependent FMN reductase